MNTINYHQLTRVIIVFIVLASYQITHSAAVALQEEKHDLDADDDSCPIRNMKSIDRDTLLKSKSFEERKCWAEIEADAQDICNKRNLELLAVIPSNALKSISYLDVPRSNQNYFVLDLEHFLKAKSPCIIGYIDKKNPFIGIAYWLTDIERGDNKPKKSKTIYFVTFLKQDYKWWKHATTNPVEYIQDIFPNIQIGPTDFGALIEILQKKVLYVDRPRGLQALLQLATLSEIKQSALSQEGLHKSLDELDCWAEIEADAQDICKKRDLEILNAIPTKVLKSISYLNASSNPHDYFVLDLEHFLKAKSPCIIGYINNKNPFIGIAYWLTDIEKGDNKLKKSKTIYLTTFLKSDNNWWKHQKYNPVEYTENIFSAFWVESADFEKLIKIMKEQTISVNRPRGLQASLQLATLDEINHSRGAEELPAEAMGKCNLWKDRAIVALVGYLLVFAIYYHIHMTYTFVSSKF